ncbi:hypothetical protein O5477_26850, partial [Escherichia coli]|nr:hypothetical protein [Escherichia coli]
ISALNPNQSGKEAGSIDRSCTGQCIPDKGFSQGTNREKKKWKGADLWCITTASKEHYYLFSASTYI